MPADTPSSPDPAAALSTRRLSWSHGSAEVQTLGGMLAPVVFRAPGQLDFSPLQVAPWADEPGSAAWPGILRRLRGEWPCVPFGRTDRPEGLPAGWSHRDPGDPWGHGYAAHHDWQWRETGDPLALCLQMDLPPGQPVERLVRTVRAWPGQPALDVSLAVTARTACTLPVALHPTLRLDAGPVALHLAHSGTGLTYPVPAEAGCSRLAADARFERLGAVPLQAGGNADFSHFPQPQDGEDLLQLMNLSGPVQAHYLQAGWTLTLDWNRSLLPDLMLWVSHRGRLYPPWNGRHWALGVEPLNGPFDLGRVARPPAGHPLASRTGLALEPGETREICLRLSAWPGAPVPLDARVDSPARPAEWTPPAPNTGEAT